jgi:DNA-binding NarL/FixJ family response regulator
VGATVWCVGAARVSVEAMIATAPTPIVRPARLVIADARPRSRAALRRALRRNRSVVVVAEAATASAAEAAVEALAPDLVLVDLCLPGLGPLGATRGLGRGSARTAVLAQVAHDDRAAAVAALRAGVRGVVRRDGGSSAVVRALEALARGAAPLFLRPTPRPPVLSKEDPVVTPKVVELSRGRAHIVRPDTARVAAAAVRKG